MYSRVNKNTYIQLRLNSNITIIMKTLIYFLSNLYHN